VPRAGGGDVNVASRERVRADLYFTFEHDAFLFAFMAMRRNDSARAHAQQAGVHARPFVRAELAHLHERPNLNPFALNRTQRARPLGRLVARAFQNSTAQPPAPLCAQLCWPYCSSERIPQDLRQLAIT
jgi:hypothetical protein